MIAYAEEHSLELLNYTFHTYCKEFESTRDNFRCQYPLPVKKVWQNRFNWISNFLIGFRVYYRAIDVLRKFPKLFHGITLKETSHPLLLDTVETEQELHKHETIFIHNWKCRCPVLVAKHENIIRDFFKPVEHHRKAADSVFSSLKDKSDLVVGIHIRQGDYKEWKNGKFYFTTDEYVKIMKDVIVMLQGQKVSFLLCSNEHQEKQQFADLQFAFGSGDPISDLYALSLCDYIIGPVSTFSQWASFYGQKPLHHLRRNKQSIKLSDFGIADLMLLEH